MSHRTITADDIRDAAEALHRYVEATYPSPQSEPLDGDLQLAHDCLDRWRSEVTFEPVDAVMIEAGELLEADAVYVQLLHGPHRWQLVTKVTRIGPDVTLMLAEGPRLTMHRSSLVSVIRAARA